MFVFKFFIRVDNNTNHKNNNNNNRLTQIRSSNMSIPRIFCQPYVIYTKDWLD